MNNQAEFFEVPQSMLSDRLDVTYYLIKQKTKQRIGTMSATRPLSTFCVPTRTKTPAREHYMDDGIPCIKLRNVTGNVLNLTNCDYIPERLKSRFVSAKKHDIIITATGQGTAGRADIFLETGTYIVTGENILLRPRLDLVNPFYLLAVLRSELIHQQLTHFVRGATGQTHLYWQDIADIQIPDADSKTQEQCEQLFLQASHSRQLAAHKIKDAKKIVLQAAGITNINVLDRQLNFEIRFNQTEPQLRYDVEYYQPIYNELKFALEKAGGIAANTVAKLNKNTINPRKSPTDMYRYIDISSINADIGDYECSLLYGHEAPTRARRKPKKSDLIISTVRPNRNAVAIIDDAIDNLVVSTGFAVVTPTSINPFVLFAILKTEQIYAQIVQKATAAMYPAVTDDDVLNILIPNLDSDQNDLIERFIRESIKLRRESDKQLQEHKDIAESLF